jgi:hypothetical protein
MQRPLLFFLAIIAISVIVYGHKSKNEGFESVTFTSVNLGTPEALYSKLPIQQPRCIDVAQTGVGNIQPSPPPASDLPRAPIGQRSKEVPNPYKDPSIEPAKYIRLLRLKEDLQAFFGFEAQGLEQTNDSAVQIPLTRARADLGELLDVQSVMERNPGLPSRINNQQLEEITSNLKYLRAVHRDLVNSGSIQSRPAKEGFANMSLPSDQRASQKELEEFQVRVTLEIAKIEATGVTGPTTQVRLKTLKRLQEDADQIIAQLNAKKLTPAKIPVYSIDIQQGLAFLGKTDKSTSVNVPVPKGSSELRSDKRASLKQLQDFQIKVVVEIQRLSASGTSDPVIVARIKVLQKIRADVDQVIDRLQKRMITPQTVPIFASDLERALPVLGKASAPLPTLLKGQGLPGILSSLFPGGLSAGDSEQLAQTNNIVKGYMKKFFDGSSWSMSYRYDNPDVEKMRLDTAKKTHEFIRELKDLNGLGAGIPGVTSCGADPVEKSDTKAQNESPVTSNNTRKDYDAGLPGASSTTIKSNCEPSQMDWKKRNKEIVEQIRKRGLNPMSFGALPDKTEVSSEFSWRGHTNMMCMRLNTTTDPGLATSVGCPPETWVGWKPNN